MSEKEEQGEEALKASADPSNTQPVKSTTDRISNEDRNDKREPSDKQAPERGENNRTSNEKSSGNTKAGAENSGGPRNRPRRGSGDSTVRRKSKQSTGKKIPLSAPGERRPSLNGIFADSDDGSEEHSGGTVSTSKTRGNDNSDESPPHKHISSPSTRDKQHRGRRRSSESGPRRRRSSGVGDPRTEEPPSARGGDESDESPRRERRRSSRLEHGDEDEGVGHGQRRRNSTSGGAHSLSQTRHAARSLAPMGTGHHSGVRKPRTRAEIKELGRAREWASFCRRKTYLSLEDLSRDQRPRTAKKGAITPFALQLMKVEGWQIPPVLVERASAPGRGLRFSVSMSFYHAGSKRFYGDTFIGDGLDEGDEARVEIISETSKGGESKRSSRSRGSKGVRRSKGSRGRRAGRGGTADDDDDVEEVEAMTRHEELVYWYTYFEDPNCLAVIELVATVVDHDNSIQVGQYGCGWTFIQFFGPNEPEAVQHRDVYRGSPRNLLFFEQGDWGSVGETAIPGCSLTFTLSIWANLTRARHLFRPDEIVPATGVLPGMQFKAIDVPDRPSKIGPFLGLRIDHGRARPARRAKTERGSLIEGTTWSLAPSRPRLAPCLEFRLSKLRVVIPGREGYERDLIKSLGEDIPDQEIVKTTTQQHALGFSRTQREIVTSISRDNDGKAKGGGGGGQRAKIVDRTAKIGFHNGHTLVLPDEWVKTHLEETEEIDVLKLPEEMASLNIDGYVSHPLFALVVLIEYTIRTRARSTALRGKDTDSRLSKKGEGGGRGKKGDPLSQAKAELNHSALPIIVGMQVFIPYDGKRLRLHNTQRDGDSMEVGLKLAADKRVRLVTTELVYTNKKHLLDEAHGGSSDDESGRGTKMVYFELKAYDSRGQAVQDETPASGDESLLEASGWEKPKEVVAESSGGTTSSTEQSSSIESSTDASDTVEDREEERSEDKPITPPKSRKPSRPKPKRRPLPKAKREQPKRERPLPEPPSSDSDSTNMSLVTGDSDASSLRQPPPSEKRNAHVQATDKGWDAWRNGLKVPCRSESLMGHTLQAPLHAEASAQTIVAPDREPVVAFYGPEAVVIGGSAPLAQDLSRASRTRLSRHGFTDVMKDTANSFAKESGRAGEHKKIAVDLNLEVTDPLAKHEITLQFAAFRAAAVGGGNGGGGGVAGGSRGGAGNGGGGGGVPISLYFTYQLYTCRPTRTERMILRPDSPKDRLYQAEGGGSSQLHILVREGRYGRDEPSLGLSHRIDTTVMQPFEAQSFACYMAGMTLFVDVWDGDALMHLGTLALPLRTLMRQQKGVVKTAMEYEVVGSTGCAEDCGSGGGIAVRHGHLGKGPVVGLVQILASNYGEPGRGGDLPASGAVPATVHPPMCGATMMGDWRMASGSAGGAGGLGQRGTRPRHKVRARPLSEANPELSKYMEAVAGPGAASGAIASLARRGRGDVDADSMGYDELMLLVRRFRGSVKGRVWYAGPLLRLLDVPGLKRLGQRLVRAVERAERGGLGLAEAFRELDTHRTGEISTHDLEEMFWGMLSPGELSREHLKILIKSMDPGATGKVGLRELMTFVKARQGSGGVGNDSKKAESGLLRAMARAELGGLSVEGALSSVDKGGRDSLSHAEFWEAMRAIGGVPGLVKSDLAPMLRRFDTAGDGRVSLPTMMDWAGRKYTSAADVENSARRKILSADASTFGKKGELPSLTEALVGARDLSDALKVLPKLSLTAREMAGLCRRLESRNGGGIDVAAALRFFGYKATGSVPLSSPTNPDMAGAVDEQAHDADVAVEEEEDSATHVEPKLRRILWKAESMGISLAEAFGVFDKDGSGFITVSELEEGLRTLGVFESIPREQVRTLVHKLKRRPATSQGAGTSDDEGLLISVEEFVHFVGGGYDATEAAEGRLRRVLELAEKNEGINLQGAFGALDKNGTGSISLSDLEDGLRKLGVFEGMSAQQAALATKRFDTTGDATVSLVEFLAFAGKPYTANDGPLEAKLRRVLLKAESMGTSMEEAFKHFDKDGSGSITSEGFAEGLREMGVFQEFSREEVDQVVASFGEKDVGGVSLPKFLRFLGKEYGRGGGDEGNAGGGLAGRLRLILKKAQELGTPLSASFEAFGSDDGGHLSAERLHAALKDIGQIRWTTLGEVKSFIRLLQDDGDGTTDAIDAKASGDGAVLTLQGLQAFVEGGDAYLEQRASKFEPSRRQQQHRDFAKVADHEKPAITPADSSAANATGPGITRASSWSEEEREIDHDGNAKPGGLNEDAVLSQLQLTFRRAGEDSKMTHIEGGGDGGGCGDAVEGHLCSFDLDDDGRLSKKEFTAALRSLGGQGSDFGGTKGMAVMISQFGDGKGDGVSIIDMTRWFERRVVEERETKGTTSSGGQLREAGRASRENYEGGDGRQKERHTERGTRRGLDVDSADGERLRRAVRTAESKGTTLERTFARLDENGDGTITLRQLLRGLDQMGVFKQATRDDVLDALDVLDADNQPHRESDREEKRGDGPNDSSGSASGVDLVSFIRLMRQKQAQRTGESTNDVDGDRELRYSHTEEEAPYEFSLDPETRAAEKRLRRVVAKQARQGVDVEGVFRQYDPEESGSVLRSDFVQAVMQLGVSLLDSIAPRHGGHLPPGANQADPVRQRQLGQLARAKGPVERRLLRMRQNRRGLFDRLDVAGTTTCSEEAKGRENGNEFEDGDESLALIQWYREGQKKSMVRHVLATSLTTEYNLFFAFASPLFFEHPLRNPFNHEERFRIDLDDHQLRVVTGAAEWEYLRRNVRPCIGDIGDGPLESEFFDIDPQRGIQVALMAHEVVFVPFVFLSLEPRGPASRPACGQSPRKHYSVDRGAPNVSGEAPCGMSEGNEGGGGAAERSVVVAFVSASHGHVVSVMQVHLQRRAFVINRTFRFYQNEGELLKRSIQLLLGAETGLAFANTPMSYGWAGRSGETYREPWGVAGEGGSKYIHCVEGPNADGSGDNAAGGVVVEWGRRPALGGGGGGSSGMVQVQEVLVKCRVGPFPSQKGFYLLVYNDHYQSSLYETWHIVVQARLRMDVHSLLGQQSPADLVVRGDRYSRKVRAFSSAPAEVSFEPPNAFQLVPGGYNRVEMRFRPLSIGSRKIHVHLVDVDSMEIVGAWLATATAMPPVVTKSYDVDLPVGRQCHKRIAYANPWTATRLFRLCSSDATVLRPRYASLEIGGLGTGYLRLWFAAPEGTNARKEAFLFVNDSEGQNEECLLIRMRGV